MKDRSYNFELMRVVSMFMVLLLHTIYPTGLEYDCTMGFTILQKFSMVAVNLFVFVSGYFSIKTRPASLSKFLFVTCFYAIIEGFIGLICGASGLLMPWWFPVAYFQLMLLAPYINGVIEQISDRQFKALILIFGFFNFVCGFLMEIPGFKTGFCLNNMVCIYLIARYVYKYNVTYSSKVCLFGYVVLCMINVIIKEYFSHDIIYYCKGITDYYNSPTIFGASLFLFLFFKNLKVKKNRLIYILASSSFPVYLISNHPIVRDFAYPHIWGLVKEYGSSSGGGNILNNFCKHHSLYNVCVN